MKKSFRVGVVGAGLIGNKRATSIRETHMGKLVAVSDCNEQAAATFSVSHNCGTIKDWQDLVADPNIDAVIVAVPNAYLAPIALQALRHGKHMLCEKPLGINSVESLRIHRAALKAGVVARVGFNHRFHAAIIKARQLFDKGAIGELLTVRARYGHGGRKGMEKEWRFNKKVSGGGELLDQGVHLIDLASWFGGRFSSAYGLAQTKFWKTEVDDNAFGLLRNEKVTFTFHVSTTNWKNIFSFELFGTDGYLQIDGKGGSYGAESLIWGRRPRQFGIPTLKKFEFDAHDESWNREWRDFARGIAGKSHVCGDTLDGAYANAAVAALYRSSSLRREIAIRFPR